MKELNPEEKIILAIDGFNRYQAISFLERCPKIKWIKIGLELFSKEGPEVIKVFKDMNKKIFLDLKFHDIPNTMRSACFEVSKLGVNIISLHAMSGSKALRTSKEATIDGAEKLNIKPPLVVGITVLTSFSEKDFKKNLNINSSIEENVIRFANISYEAGLDGCVCAPCEVKKLRSEFSNDFQLITPGIRLGNENKNDQNRIMNPYDAVSNGASKLVIGRSITKSQNPNKLFDEICRGLS